MRLGFLIILIFILMVSTAGAEGIEVQLRHTKPGIANMASAEQVFSIFNSDITHYVEGFIWCSSSNDVMISSSYGVGVGNGANYISPKFILDINPSQQAQNEMTITVKAETPGDKNLGCYVKYIPFKVVSSIEVVTESGIDPGTGEETLVNKNTTKELRLFQMKGSNNYVETATDSDYREIRLDKTVPFARPGVEEPACPEGQSTCSASEVIDLGAAGKFPKWILLVAGLVVVLLVVYLLGKTSRKE